MVCILAFLEQCSIYNRWLCALRDFLFINKVIKDNYLQTIKYITKISQSKFIKKIVYVDADLSFFYVWGFVDINLIMDGWQIQINNKNIIVMKINHRQNNRPKEQLAITTELIDVLREVNLNSSWKNGSTKFSKNKTGCIYKDNKYSNLMTQNDLDQLFNRSKEKSKLKTQTSSNHINTNHSPLHRDFTAIRFLQLEDQFDKMLTGISYGKAQKENSTIFMVKNQTDLTLKFKKDYMVGKVIGQGAYASVRVAVYKPQNKKIAIKAYEKVKIKQLQRKKTVRRQIKILQMVNHPNIVKIYDVVETNNHVNIIMEYLPGISLGSSLRQNNNHKLNEVDCKKIIRELAGALKYLHERNIAHRDIKLQNVILDDKMSPKLIDFGFSTCIQKSKKIKIFCGTPSYMAPEIVQKKEYRGQAADIWALGVLLFVMITGYFPYKGATDQQLYRKINQADYPKTQIINFKSASNLIAKIFTIEAEERITAQEILNHSWINEIPNSKFDFNKNRIQQEQIKKILNRSKERQRQASFVRQEDRSKSKKPIENEKNILRTVKEAAHKFNATLGRNRFEKTTVNPLRQDTSHSIKKPKKQNQIKIVDLLKFQLKKRSQQKSKCKSHRN